MNAESSTTRTRIGIPIQPERAPSCGPLQRRDSCDRLRHERCDVHDEGNAAVTEDGRARDARNVPDQMTQRLDHDLLLADQAIDDEADVAFGGVDRDDQATACLSTLTARCARRLSLEGEAENPAK